MHFEAPHISVNGSEGPTTLTMVEEWLGLAQVLEGSENQSRSDVVFQATHCSRRLVNIPPTSRLRLVGLSILSQNCRTQTQLEAVPLDSRDVIQSLRLLYFRGYVEYVPSNRWTSIVCRWDVDMRMLENTPRFLILCGRRRSG